MPCVCEKCGNKVCDCGEKYCDQCFIEECCKTETEKNMFLGGQFYRKKPLKKEGDEHDK